MLLEEDVVMNEQEIRLPLRPAREAPDRPHRMRQATDEDCTPVENIETSPYSPSPPPVPWPRVFPGL